MNYVIDHIPKNTPNDRRPGLPMTPTTITIHNTGNPTSTARNERNWLTNPDNTRMASYHIAVDEREAIECLPLSENAWHAGDGIGVNSGNRTSIGIEICESGDYAKTLDNAAELVAKMLQERGWGVDRLRRHWDWSGKICPRLMYASGRWTGWTAFINLVQYKMGTAKEAPIVHTLDKGVAESIITSFLSPAWFRAEEERSMAENEGRADDVEAWRKQRDYNHWLAEELRRASGLEGR